MRFPVYLGFGPIALHPHWVFEVVAYAVAFWLYQRQRRQQGDLIDARSRRWVTGAAVVGGLIGNRLLDAFEDPVALAEGWADSMALLGGKTIVGGLIGGLIAVEWIKRRLGVGVSTGDLLTRPLILGIAIGRVGCFLSGLADRTYGVATSLPWGVDFGDGVRRHPTQLYEIVFLRILFLLITRTASRWQVAGDQFKLFMVAYLTFRLLVDALKPSVTIGGLSAIQWACLATLAYYAPHVPRWLRRRDVADRVRPYLFYDVAVSICSTCYQKVEGKIVFQDDAVYMLKRCPTHGHERVLMADDVDYYRRCREVFIKTPEMPRVFNTPVKWGCPYDCGLCADHQQHSCVSLIEVTDHCNLECPICYAGSSPSRPHYRTLDHIQQMIDAVVRNEGEPDTVQISGGEPTLHPDFFAILDRAKAAPIRHLMINTNGIRIAQDEAFAQRLASYMPDIEVYLQFDSFRRDALLALRGADLRSVHEKALERLNRLGASTTLVVTLKKNLNDDEVGAIIDFALTQPAVRGVTFQPIQTAGRLEHFDPATDRLTLTEVRRRILTQTTVFRPEDVIPVPCHPDSLAMAYALKLDGKVIPLTGVIEPKVLIEGGRNTIVFEQDDAVRAGVFKLFATNHSPESAAGSLRELLCCLPRLDAPAPLGYENIFRVLIMQFIDAHSFDVRSVKKTCVHIVHPDRRLIPFDTYNLFYRDGLEHSRLAPLRAQAELATLGRNP